MADYLKTSKTPFITFIQYGNDILQFGGDNVYIWGTLKVSGRYLATYAWDELGYKTATIMHADNAPGEDYTQGFIDVFEEKGGTIVERQRIPADAMDYAPTCPIWARRTAACSGFTVTGSHRSLQLRPVRRDGSFADTVQRAASEFALGEAGDAGLG